MPLALLYNLNDRSKLQALRFAFVKLGIRGRTVAPPEYGHPIGWLCGLEGYSPAPQPAEGSFSDEMLVLCGLSAPQLDALLNTLRLGHTGISLKAVVTEENAAWTSLRLHDEIRREHEAMREMRAPKGGRRPPRRK